MSLNVRLLRRVQRAIIKEPGRLNMEEGLMDLDYAIVNYAHGASPPCGTVGCIAGWTVALSTRARTKIVTKVRVALGDEPGYSKVRWDHLQAREGPAWAKQ